MHVEVQRVLLQPTKTLGADYMLARKDTLPHVVESKRLSYFHHYVTYNQWCGTLEVTSSV